MLDSGAGMRDEGREVDQPIDRRRRQPVRDTPARTEHELLGGLLRDLPRTGDVATLDDVTGSLDRTGRVGLRQPECQPPFP